VKSIGKPSKMLGIAIGEKSMQLAEVAATGGTYSVLHIGQFTYPAGKTLSEPEAIGAALGQYLKNNGFGARRAVFGLPAKWVLSKPKEVPAADEATVSSMLRLQSESDFSPELKDMAYDYTGTPNSREERTVLLLATPRKHLEQINAIAAAAKVDVHGVTVSVAALSAATSRVKKNSLVLALGPGGAELGAQPVNGPSVLRHVGPASAAASPMLMGELRRATAVNGNGNGFGVSNGNGHAQRELILWDDEAGDSASSALTACRTMGEAAGLAVSDGELSTSGISGTHAGQGAATAVARAAEALQGRLPIDFLNTRLAPPKEQKYDRRVVYGVGAGAVLALLIFTGWFDLHRLQNSVDQKKAQIASQKKNVDAYKEQVGKIETLLAWHNGTPRLLPCLNDLTRAFPAEHDLYLVGFSMRQDQRGELTGTIQGRVSGTNTGPVLTLMDRMYSTNRFGNVSPQARDTTDSNKEAQFSINFTYLQPTGQPSQGNGAKGSPPRAPAPSVSVRR
jgi:hypothetical protein